MFTWMLSGLALMFGVEVIFRVEDYVKDQKSRFFTGRRHKKIEKNNNKRNEPYKKKKKILDCIHKLKMMGDLNK